MESIILSWIDYIVFSSLLGVSLLIGVYFGFWSKQDTTTDYLFGGKTMSYVPVAISLLSSYLSGITYVGLPSEVYFYGAKVMAGVLAAICVGFATVYLFLPIFFKLQLPSTNVYLELRFSKSVRKLSSLIYILGLLAILSIIVYVPALAFARMTDLDLHTVTPILSIICFTYTSMGGVKAVVYTDTFQFVWTIIGVASILTMGIVSAGGIMKVWEIADQGGRTVMFDMSPSVFERNEFWTIFAGFFLGCISRFSIGQKFVAKFLSIKTEENARKAIWLMIAGWVTITIVTVLMGITMYAKYHVCDPYKSGRISKTDEILPYFVLDVAGHIPGLPGLFLAGLVSSALATMSASLNTLGGIIYDDFIDELLPQSDNRERRAANIMKLIVVLIGIISIGLVYVIEQLGTIFEMIMSIGSILDGPLLGLFILGMFFPWAGTKGALAGGYSSLIIMICYVSKTQWHVRNKHIRYTPLPTYVNACIVEGNATLTIREELPPLAAEDEPATIFKVSMLHFTFVGSFIVVVIGLIVSWITGEMNSSKVNPDYMVPGIKRILPKGHYVDVPSSEKETEKEKINLETC